MLSVVYVSSATRLMDDSELTELLRISRINNLKIDVTGMLLYEGGNFMQVLEGPDSRVSEIADKISGDPRHTGMLTLLRQNVEERQFASWSMAFQNIAKLSEEERDAFSDFLVEPITADGFRSRPHRAYKLLLSFRDRLVANSRAA